MQIDIASPLAMGDGYKYMGNIYRVCSERRMSVCISCVNALLLLVALHQQDLDETNEYIDHVKLKCNRFTERISLHDTLICKASVFYDLLSVVENETAKYSQSTI